MAKLTTNQRKKVPGDDYAVPGKRMLPMNDAKHVKMAWDMVDRTDDLTDAERQSARRRILRKAKKLGIDTSSWDKASLKAGYVESLEASDEHPNKAPFEGLLTWFNVASDKPVGGSGGNLVYIPAEVGIPALKTLEGMAVDVRSDLSGHSKLKIGVIEKAWAGEPDETGAVPVYVAGYLYAKDFPEEVEELRAEQDDLGFSYEADGEVELMANAVKPTVITRSITFSGAAILYRDKAAYTNTSLAAEGDEESLKLEDFVKMFLKAMGEDPAMESKDEAAEQQDEDGDAAMVEAAFTHLAEVINHFAEFKEYFGGDGKWANLSVNLQAAEETIKAQAAKIESLEASLTAVQTKLDAAATPDTSAFDALKTEVSEKIAKLEPLMANADALTAEAEQIAKYSRKSVAWPQSFVAKFEAGGEKTMEQMFAEVDADASLATQAKIQAKIEIRRKYGK